MRAGEGNPVPAALIEVVHAGQRGADDAHVLELAPAQRSSTSMPAASSGWGRSGSSLNHASRVGRDDRQAEHALDERAVVDGADAGAGDAAGGEDERIGGETERARGRLGVDRR